MGLISWVELGKRVRRVAKKIDSLYSGGRKTKRPGVHSKNASPGKRGHKKAYRGQGR